MDSSVDYNGLAKLIAACSKAKVSKLKCGTVEVEFSSDTMVVKEWASAALTSTEIHGKGENKVEFKRAEPNEDELLLSDPLEYERLQFEG
jgi:hypothetical protein